MRIPNFFIVGAPKCGTTAMNDYLSEHPEIFMGPKELHFFGSDLVYTQPRITKEQYLSRFLKAEGEKRIGEASVLYLHSNRAAGEIKEFCSGARIIVMLRNPVDMIYSLHRQLLYDLDEDITDFETALDAENDRRQGLRIPSTAVRLNALYYGDVAGYTLQIQRYLDVFGRENVHVIIYDDFRDDTPGAYKETLCFLGVHEEFMPDFNVINPNKRVRNEGLQYLLKILNLKSKGRARFLAPPPIRHLGRAFRKLNTSYEPRSPMDPELRIRLQAEFALEVERLSELLERDLTHWIKD